MKYDLAVVGGGIIGCGVARDAALRGLKVALFEKDDFGSGTTSRSTRLIHGGLRYLAHYDFALVREALAERKTLLRIAPHLVRPLPFLFPVYRTHGHGVPTLWTGLFLYDFLNVRRGVPHHRFLPPNVCLRLEPALRSEGLVGGFLYYDAQCAFPERLCLENALDAADRGARVENHARVVALERTAGRVTGVRVRHDPSKAEETVEAELVVNCAGPWLDEVERLALPSAEPMLRRTKGIHLVVPRFVQHAVILETHDGQRVIFAIPWGDHTLVGTTDTDYEGPNEDVRADAEDVDYLLREVEAVLNHSIERRDILFTTAGLRPLQRQVGRSTAQITRREKVLDHEVESGLRGYVTVVGGKITTYRHIAATVVDFALKKLGRRRAPCGTAREPLPGGRLGRPWAEWLGAFLASARDGGIPADVGRHLADVYGSVAPALVSAMRTHKGLAARIDRDGPWVWAEVRHAVDREKAQTVEDVLLRRLVAGLQEGQGRGLAPQVASSMAKRLGWDRRRETGAAHAYLAALDRNWIVNP